jgi:hypothetical protein
MPRRRIIAIAVLALVLIAAPFLPRGGDDNGPDGTLSSSDLLAHATTGRGQVTPAMQREIDAVVASGRTPGRAANGVRPSPADLVRNEVRCAEFEGQQYCLHTGWTTRPESEVVNELAERAAARQQPLESTGDLDLLASLRQHSKLTPSAQAAADRAELTEAAASVAKVWLLRHQLQGVPLPDGFVDDHPEIQLRDDADTSTSSRPQVSATPQVSGSPTSATSPSPTATASPVKPAWKYTPSYTVLRKDRVAEQTRSYWCGPTTMQMIGWGWTGTKRTQATWAERLNTTTNGTAITDMVRVTNRYTGWDRDDRAGRYVTLDISDWSYSQWWLLNMRHYADYRAPIILHPVLLKEFFPYLDDDASGHFQVGRGYAKNGADPNTISFFEPWNQQRFDPSEPYIARVQWRSAYRSYRANKAHFQHNLGV